MVIQLKLNTSYGWGNHASAGYLTSYSETDTLDSVTSRGRSTSTDGSSVWDVTTPGTGVGNIHVMSIATDDSGGAITFDASDANSAQAGIYVKSDGNYGTKMYIATTDSYATGSKTAISIDHYGKVNIVRGNDKLQVNGNRVHHAGDFSTTNVANGVTAYGWGNHSLGGYLTSESYTSHENTSALNGNYGGNNNGVVVEDITVDSNGHITAVGSRDLDGRFMLQGQELSNPDTIINGGNRYNPNGNNPTSEHYAILTYGNGGNVTGQLATHFQTGDLYSRGYNSSWSTWKKYFNTDDFTTTNVSNWNTAYGWGNHASAGYLTSYTETDPIYISERDSLRLNKMTQSTLLFSTLENYNKPSGYSTMIQPTSYQNPLTNSHGYYHILGRRDGGGGYGALLQSYNGNEIFHGNTTQNTNNINWHKIWTDANFTQAEINNWGTAHSWGDHSLAGYTGDQDLSGYATETYVGTQIDNLINSAPGLLNTLDELAAALGDDPSFATTITTSIATKLPLSGRIEGF